MPPRLRAISQVYSAVRRLPMCIYPVGEGANRVRTCPLGMRASMASKYALSVIRTTSVYDL